MCPVQFVMRMIVHVLVFFLFYFGSFIYHTLPTRPENHLQGVSETK